MIADQIHQEAEDVLRNLGPKVSNNQYEKGFNKFWDWRKAKGVAEDLLPNEDQIIVFIKDRQAQYNYKPSSIKPMISMLKSQIIKRFGFDILNEGDPSINQVCFAFYEYVNGNNAPLLTEP